MNKKGKIAYTCLGLIAGFYINKICRLTIIPLIFIVGVILGISVPDIKQFLLQILQ